MKPISEDPAFKAMEGLPSGSIAEENAAAEAVVAHYASAPKYHGFLVHAIRANDLPVGLAAHLARELVRKMTPEARDELVRSEFDPDSRHRDRLWWFVIGAFAVVLCGSFLALAWIAVLSAKCELSKTATTYAQMLLTVFTTCVGFLSGLFAPNPLERSRPSFRSTPQIIVNPPASAAPESQGQTK